MPTNHYSDLFDATRYATDFVTRNPAEKIDISECSAHVFAFALLHDLMNGTIDILDVDRNSPNLRGGYHFDVRMYRKGAGETRKLDIIQRVIFNDPATIVYWIDGTKTVVKCGENEPFDPEKGLAMAITKKMLGNKGNYYDTLKKWLPAKPIDIPVDHCKVFPEDKKEPKGPSLEWDEYIIQKLREVNGKLKDINEQLRSQNNDGSH